MKPSRAFTLLELVIVLMVIGILLALLFPASPGRLNAAKKAQAWNDVAQIANATLAYKMEYGIWPPGSKSTATPVSGSFLQALTGSNIRSITFLETESWKSGYGGVTNNAYEDSWGNVYQIVVDENDSKSVNVTCGLRTGSGSINFMLQKSVAVFNITNSSDSSWAGNYYRHSVQSW